MRIVVMGTGPFAVPTFDWLAASEHDVPALVTRPARVLHVHGRDKSPPCPMRERAEARGLAVFDPEDINVPEFRERLASFAADLFLVCDYGQILSRETLATARFGGINLHGSLLPRHRGAAPVNWAILCGDTTTGVSVIHMTPQLDGGPCLAQRSTPIDADEDAALLEQRLSRLGVEPVQESIAALAAWDGRSPIGKIQDKALATRAPRLKKSDGEVDWTRSASEIRNRVRALKPWPGTFTWLLSGKSPLRLILEQVTIVAEPTTGAAEPGEIVLADTRCIHVRTGAGELAIERVQPAGKRSMDISEFLCGRPLRPGQRFGQ